MPGTYVALTMFSTLFYVSQVFPAYSFNYPFYPSVVSFIHIINVRKLSLGPSNK